MKIITDKKNKKATIRQTFLWITLWEYVIQNNDWIFIFIKNGKEIFHTDQKWDKPQLIIETPMTTLVKNPAVVGREKYELYVSYNSHKYLLSFGHIVWVLIPLSWRFWFFPWTFTYTDIKKIWDATGIGIPFSKFEQVVRWWAPLLSTIIICVFILMFLIVIWSLVYNTYML